MLDSFRNFTKSLFGKIVVFIVLGVIGLAFALTDVTGMRNGSFGKATVLAKVGSYEVTDVEVTKRLQDLLRDLNARGQQPVTMELLLQRGGYEYVVSQIIMVNAIKEFGRDSGITVNRAMLDSVIANDPRFQGVDGKFSQAAFDNYLQQTGKTAADWWSDVAVEKYAAWMFPDLEKKPPVADGLVAPYASAFLERRLGFGTVIRPQDMDAGPAPDEKALAAFYTRNKARYQVAERRSMRYAIVTPEAFKAQGTATEDEIAKAFAASGTRFAATEKRTIQQIVFPDKATADKGAADLKAGKSVADVAKAYKLAPTEFKGVDKAELSQKTSPAVANSAFTGPAGVVGPVQSLIGWAVIKVENIENIPAKTLAQAHDELAKEISERKTAELMNSTRQGLEDGIGNGATFDETMKNGKLTPQVSAALFADGTDPDRPLAKDAKPDQAMVMIAAAGFQFDPESQEPLVVPTGQDGSFAIVVLDKRIPATAPPLANIREKVLADYALDQQLIKARKTAQDLRAEINKGTPMPEAIAKLGIRALPPKPFSLVRGELTQNDPPQTQMVFSTAPKTDRKSVV